MECELTGFYLCNSIYLNMAKSIKSKASEFFFPLLLSTNSNNAEHLQVCQWPHCGDNSRLTPSYHIVFDYQLHTALPFNWDWSNEQSAKFLRHIWQSVFIIKLKLAAPFSSSTADGPYTGTLLTAWQRMEGFCHDCLGYPLSFGPKMMHRVTESLSWWSAFRWLWCLP